MNRIYLVVLAILIFSCNSKSDSKDGTDKSKPENLVTCLCNELNDKEGVKYYQSKLFTGTCFSYYPETKLKYEESKYDKGIVQNIKYFSKDGKVLTDNDYFKGERIENDKRCDCTELKMQKLIFTLAYKLGNRYFEGICKSYYPNDGGVYREEWFKTGLRDGPSKIYDKQGNIISITHYKNGHRFGASMVYDMDGNVVKYEEYGEMGELIWSSN